MQGTSLSSRRAVSLPEKMTLPGLRIPLYTESDEEYFEDEKRGSSLLPLSVPSSPRRTARRLTMGLRLRASRYSIPLLLISIVLAGVFFFAAPTTRSHGLQGRSRFHLKSHDSLHLPSRNLGGQGAPNGVSLLGQEEDELIAEDDLYWDNTPDHKPLTEKEKAAEAEMQAHKLDVMEQNRMGSLRALIWWIAEGGVFPADWEIPSKSYLKKVGARGMERLLEDIDAGTDEEAIFEDGWADFAKRRYRIAVFSKSYCPYSRKAKGIMEEYRLTPAPFVIELDQRPDTHTIQTLLDHLTNRRTVPNIIFDFVPVGGADDLMLLHSEGGLKRKFSEMGVVPGSIKRPSIPDIPEEIPPPLGAPAMLEPAKGPAPKKPVELDMAPPAAQKKPVGPAKPDHHGAAPIANPPPGAKRPDNAAAKGQGHALKPVVPAAPVAKRPGHAAQPMLDEPMQHAFNAPNGHQPIIPLGDDEEGFVHGLLPFSDEEDEFDMFPMDDTFDHLPMPDLDLEDDIGEMEDDEPDFTIDRTIDDEMIVTPPESDNEHDMADFVPSPYEFDPELYDDYDDDDAAMPGIAKGASPADIRAAIQAAHGDEYLYQSDDEEATDGDFAYVGDFGGMPFDDSDMGMAFEEPMAPPPPPPPVQRRPNRVEQVAKIAKPAVEKVAAMAKDKVAAVAKEKIEAVRGGRKAQAVDAVQPKKAKEVAAPKKAAKEVAAPKKAERVNPQRKAPVAAAAPPAAEHPKKVAHHNLHNAAPAPVGGAKKAQPVAPPRNKVEAMAQKKAEALEAIAEKKAELAAKKKVEQVAAPRKKAAPKADAAAAPVKGAGADARRRKGMDKVDAREVLKPGVKKDVPGKKEAPAKKDAAGRNADANPRANANARGAGRASPKAPVKKAPNPAAAAAAGPNAPAAEREYFEKALKDTRGMGKPGKQEMKLGPGDLSEPAPLEKKAEPAVAGAKKRKGGAGAAAGGVKRDTFAEAKADLAKKDDKGAPAAKRGAEKANPKARKEVKPKQVVKRKGGKVL